MIELEKFGSLYVVATGESIPDEGLLTCLNMEVLVDGCIAGRSGIVEARDSGLATGAIFPIGPLDNGNILCYHNGSGRFYVLNITGLTYTGGSTVGSFVNTEGGALADDGKYYLPKGSSNIVAVDNTGTSVNSATGFSVYPPTIYHQGRIFCASRNGSLENKLVWSGVNAYTTFGGTDYTYVGDGKPITGLVSLGDRVIIFKNQAVWVLYTSSTPSNWVIRRVSAERGNFRTSTLGNPGNYPIEIEGKVYFADLDGFYVTDGVSFKDLSKDVIARVFTHRSVNTINYCRVFHNLITIEVDSVNYVYNIDTGNWSTVTASTFTNLRFAVDINGRVWFGSTTNNSNKSVQRFSTGSDQDTIGAVSTAFTKTVKTKYFTFGDRTKYKQSKVFWIEAQGVFGGIPAYTPGFYADSTSPTTRAAETLPSTGEPTIARYEGNVPFRRLAFYFTSTATTAIKLLAFGSDAVITRDAD